MSDKHVDDLDDWSPHPGGLKVLVRAEVELSQRLPQHLGFGDVDGNELQDPILRNDADNHGPLSLVVHIDQRNSTCARLEHPPTSLIERFQRINGHRLNRSHSQSFLNVLMFNQCDATDAG